MKQLSFHQSEHFSFETPEILAFWDELFTIKAVLNAVFLEKIAFAKDKYQQYAIPMNSEQALAQIEWGKTIDLLELITADVDLSKGTHILLQTQVIDTP